MSADLHAGFAFSMHAIADKDLTSTAIRELVILAAMDEDNGNEDVLRALLKALLYMRQIEQEDNEGGKQVEYPDDPEKYFFEAYQRIAKKNDYAFSEDDIWWEGHWPTEDIWAADELEYLATLIVGKDINTRKALIAYLKENHPEMLSVKD